MKWFASLALLFLFSPNANATYYDDIREKLRQIILEYPNHTDFVSLGDNDQGIAIEGIKIEMPTSGAKSKHLVVGTHHGNEVGAENVALQSAREILKSLTAKDNSQTDVGAWSSAFFVDRVVYVFPVLNISGYNTRRRVESDARNVWHDPNRDYPDACEPIEYFKLKSTQALARFIEDEDIVGAVTIHGYIGTFTFPWGFYTSSSTSPDHNFFVQVMKTATSYNKYRYGTHKDVIYPASGTFEDWAYFTHGVWSSLLEINRNNDVVKDAKSVVSYLAQLPESRSFDHGHYGSCETPNQSFPQSRP